MFLYIVPTEINHAFMTTLFLIAAVLYAAELVWLRWGLSRADRAPKDSSFEPTVSVVVAARNEEERIRECLTSLAALDFPPSKLEIIIVDDRSTDRTGELIDQFAASNPNVKKVVSGPPAGTLHGKANALQHGIAASGGEILMFTDADCRVPRTWVKETVSRFDPGTAVVGGFTLLDARTPFEGMQQLDWIMLFGVAASAAGWGSPLTAIGNNLSVRRSAYDACGGFAGIPFSVTEDYALVQAILRTTRMNVRFPLSPGALVASKPCGSFWQLYRQKQRWVVGGLDMVFRGLLIMAFGWIYRALLVIGWAFVPLPWYLGAVAVIIALEAMFLARPLRAFGAIASLRHLAAFQLYYLPYVLLTPLVAMLSKDVVWKERTLTKEGN